MEPFIGQIILFGGNFAPRGWAMCNGQLLSIASNAALYSILGTTYGGDGRVTFGLPDLRGRAAIGIGQGPGLGDYTQGEKGGVEHVTLTNAELPAHNHSLSVSKGDGTTPNPENAYPARGTFRKLPLSLYAATADTAMGVKAISPTGGSQPHENRAPYLAMNYLIALEGIFPSRS